VPRVLLLIPSATYRAPDFLEAARALDVEVVVACEEPQALSGLMGSRALRLPLGDPDRAAKAIVKQDSLTPLDAIVAVDDQGAVAAAAASEQLGLRHNPPHAVTATRDKLAMRALLAQQEVPQPDYATIPAGAGPAEIALAAKTVGLPCVVKPATLSASQGVLRADSPEDAVAVAQRVRRIATGAGVDPEAPLLVERFVSGNEVALEGLIDDGALDVLAVFDKPDPLDGPTFEETIYVTPSRLAHRDIETVLDITRKAAQALGLREGPVHAELRVRDGRAWMIEIAARTIGGLCSRALAFSTGRTLEQLVLAHAIGSHLGSLEREEGASGVLMIPIPRAGTLLGVEGVSRVLAVPGVTDVQITIPPGRDVIPVPEGSRYLGFVFARAKRPGDVQAALRRALSLLEVHIEG
jgi:biotin carboxylase